jgi:hypothetical protein
MGGDDLGNDHQGHQADDSWQVVAAPAETSAIGAANAAPNRPAAATRDAVWTAAAFMSSPTSSRRSR